MNIHKDIEHSLNLRQLLEYELDFHSHQNNKESIVLFDE